MNQLSQIPVDPLHIKLHNRGTLLIADRTGAIDQGWTGLYFQDTRHLSFYRITINQFGPSFLSTAWNSYYSVTQAYTNREFGTRGNVIAPNTLYFRVDRAVGDGLHDDFSLTNYAGRPVKLQLVISIDADFADIMQVRGFGRLIPRLASVSWDSDLNALSFRYRNRDFVRTTTYRCFACETPPLHVGRSLSFEFMLDHGASWRVCSSITFDAPGTSTQSSTINVASRRATTPMNVEMLEWAQRAARIVVPDPDIQATFNQAITDLASLRLERIDNGWFPAAGVPWFVAVFGRDSIWTSLQTLLVDRDIGRGTLAQLAALQSDRYVPARDQELGKIPHEVRLGELTHFGELPFSPYYGTADASLLYVILLAAAYAYTGDKNLVVEYLPVAERCLNWAAEWGDFDGDGFIEYFPHGPKGYHNQGWKDACGAIVYPTGEIVPTPIALCEIQGYYFAALRSMARLLRACGHEDAAAVRDRQADELRVRFERTFWMPDLGFYALGLDPAKQPIRTIASNQGHLLWSGIVSAGRARFVANRLMRPDMFAGWGIRTLSGENPAFEPISYQNGSVWPHDNGIIAMGMKRYGLWRESNQIARVIFDAADRFERHSLPELYGGLPRHADEPPVPYLEANVPQAWAAGSVFHLFRTMLGLDVDAASEVVSLRPTLPDWLPELELRGLETAQTRFDLRFVGSAPRTQVEVVRQDGPAKLVVQPVEG